MVGLVRPSSTELFRRKLKVLLAGLTPFALVSVLAPHHPKNSRYSWTSTAESWPRILFSRGSFGSDILIFKCLTPLMPKSSENKVPASPWGLRVRITRAQKKELERTSTQCNAPHLLGRKQMPDGKCHTQRCRASGAETNLELEAAASTRLHVQCSSSNPRVLRWRAPGFTQRRLETRIIGPKPEPRMPWHRGRKGSAL